MSCNSNCVPFGTDDTVTLTFPANCPRIAPGAEPFNITIIRDNSSGATRFLISLRNPTRGSLTYQLEFKGNITEGGIATIVQPLPLNVNISQGPANNTLTNPCGRINLSTITTVVLGPLSFGSFNNSYRLGDTYVIQLVGCCPNDYGPLARFTAGSNSAKFAGSF